jgi:nitroreductase
MDIIEKLKWRYATKRFDAARKLSEKQLHTVLSAANLAASSLGLQPFNLLLVNDASLREQLSSVCYQQPQITEASHLVIFAAKTNLSEIDTEKYLQQIMKFRQVSRESLNGMASMINNLFVTKTKDELTEWATRQAYISLGFLLTTCAIEQIDACPMEGFEKQKVDELLGLSKKGLTAVAIAALGFRSANDKYQHSAKVRKSLDEMILRY